MTAERVRGAAQRRSRPWLTLVGGVLGGAMVGLDGTAITIAAPYITSSVNGTLGDLELITNAYLVALAIGLLPAGRLADRIGRRRTFVIGVAVFGLASLGVALSGGVATLVAFRVLQGFAGALLQPAALAVLRNAFPAEKLGLPLGIWGGANALAIGLGPVIAGLIVQGFGWQAVFLLNVPVAVLTVAIAFFAVAESKGDGTGRGGLRRLVRDRSVTLGATLVGVSSFGVFALLFLLTLYLQNARGMSPVTTGLWMLAPTCVIVVSAPIGGLLAQRHGPRWPVTAGLVLVAAGLVGMTSFDQGSGFSDLLVPGLLVGFGTGLCVIAATEAIMGGAPDELSGLASGLQQVASQLGGVLGIVAAGGVMSWRVSDALGRHSTEAGLPDPVAATVRAGTDAVTQGKVPDGFDPGTVGARLSNAVSAVAKLSFVDAMGVAFLVIAAVSLLGAIAGVLIPKATAPEPSEETPEPALTP